MTMNAHKQTTPATLEQLHMLPEPPSLGPRHRPVSHCDYVTSLLQGLDTLGVRYTDLQMTVGQSRTVEGRRLDNIAVFGQVALHTHTAEQSGMQQTMRTMLAFRNDTTERFAMQIVAGAKVFVCDNLMLSGDTVVLKRKNTTGLSSTGLRHLVRDALAFTLNDKVTDLVQQARQLSHERIDDCKAAATLEKVFAHGVLPLRMLPEAHRNYFDARPDEEDSRSRTSWGLYNACTRCLRDLPMHLKQRHTQALGRVFNL